MPPKIYQRKEDPTRDSVRESFESVFPEHKGNVKKMNAYLLTELTEAVKEYNALAEQSEETVQAITIPTKKDILDDFLEKYKFQTLGKEELKKLTTFLYEKLVDSIETANRYAGVINEYESKLKIFKPKTGLRAWKKDLDALELDEGKDYITVEKDATLTQGLYQFKSEKDQSLVKDYYKHIGILDKRKLRKQAEKKR